MNNNYFGIDAINRSTTSCSLANYAAITPSKMIFSKINAEENGKTLEEMFNEPRAVSAHLKRSDLLTLK